MHKSYFLLHIDKKLSQQNLALLDCQTQPGVQFGQHPEFLEDYLPWSPEVQEACQ
jgi:hypothetical protein